MAIIRLIHNRQARCCLAIAAGAALFSQTAQAVAYDQYLSTGDNLYVGSWLPLDSPAAIDASFNMLKDVFNTRRIYWRGMEDEFQTQTVPRPENVVFNKFIGHLNQLINVQGMNTYAVQAAHSRGIQIWGQTSMYDFGSGPDVGTYGFPALHENPIRASNPQWVPVDKFGVRRQGGPLEYAYSGARDAAVNLLKNNIQQVGYDGVLLHSYAENFSTRYGDEFGFSDPIVAEFKNRYGVDIRRETFNKQNWYNLRGEYTTTFLQELKNAIGPQGKKVGVGISPVATSSPMLWLGNPNFPTAGNINLNWQQWAQNGSVSQLLVWGGTSSGPAAMNQLIAGTQGTSIEISPMTSSPNALTWLQYKQQGRTITESAGDEWQYLIGSDIPVQPKSSLTSTDQYKRMRTLSQIVEGTMTATVAEVTPLLNDSNLLNRRLALRSLGKIGGAAAITAMENALLDPEVSIRNAAIYGLIDSNSTSSYDAIINAVDQHGEFSLFQGAYSVLNQRQEWVPNLVSSLGSSSDPNVRALAIRSLASLAYGASNITPAQVPTIITAVGDTEPVVRAFAIDTLGEVSNSTPAVNRLVQALPSSDTVIASRAATSLSRAIQRGSPATATRRPELIGRIAAAFNMHGDGTARADKDWAYRPIGNALLDIGSDGNAVLKSFMYQRSDRRLSELAWQVVYLPQRSHTVEQVTEAQDEYAHFKRPRWDPLTIASDNFNDKTLGSSIANQTPQNGKQWTILAGNNADQTVQNQYSNGGNALKVVRRLGQLQSLKLSGYDRDMQAAELTTVTAKADWLHLQSDDTTTLGIGLGGLDGPTIYIDPGSNYRIWQSDGTPSGGSYISSGYQAGTGGWETIELSVTFKEAAGSLLAGSYDVYLTRSPQSSLGALPRTLIADDIPVASINEQTPLSLIISNQANGVHDVTTYWDNVSFTLNGVSTTSSTWNLASSGDWNAHWNWTSGAPNGVGHEALLGGAITSPKTLYTDVPLTLGKLRFNNANRYVIGGEGPLTIQTASGSGTIQVDQGSHKISLPLIFASNSNVSVTPGATLTVADVTTIKAGKTVTKSGNLIFAGPLSIEVGGSLVSAGGATTLTDAPALALGASIDATDSTLLVSYLTASLATGAILSQIRHGYNDGAWNGSGINTSAAIAGETGLGWIDDARNQQILIRLTRYGDANLDGEVSTEDFNLLAASYGTVSGGIWNGGDFDYDGRVNTLDFNLLAGNFGRTAPLASLGSVVPEPGTLGLICILGVAGLTRRRRN